MQEETPSQPPPLIKPVAQKPGPLRTAYESPNKERKLAAAHAVYVANDKKGPKSIYTKYKGVCFYAYVDGGEGGMCIELLCVGQ